MRVYNKEYNVSLHKHNIRNHHLMVIGDIVPPQGMFCFIVESISDWIPSTTSQDNLDKNYIELEYKDIPVELQRKLCFVLHSQGITEPLNNFNKNVN